MKIKMMVCGALFALFSSVAFASTSPQLNQGSIPELGSVQASAVEAAEQVTKISVSMYSPGMVNSSNSIQSAWGYNPTGTVLDVIGILKKMPVMQIDIASTNDWVSTSVWLYSDKGVYLFGGGASGKPEPDGSGKWRLPANMSSFTLYLAWEIPLAGVSNVASARIKLRDSTTGEFIQDIWLRVDDGVPFWLPYYAGANGEVEFVFTDGLTVIKSLKDGSVQYPITLAGMPDVKIAGLIALGKDTNQATVVAYADGNYGDTPPFFLEETTGPRLVSVNASTTDGQQADGYWVRKSKDSSLKWRWWPADGGASTLVTLPDAGNWYIVPYWSKFGHPIFYQQWYGGGKGG